MSVFNGQSYLSEAIESILNQTFREYEFLIIDDGSTDKTPEILAEYASHDERIRVHRHENKGRAASLNIGIALSRAPYIARMDADDVALPNRLKDQIEYLDRHPDVGVLGGAFDLTSANGRFLKTVRYPSDDSELRLLILIDNPICHPAAIMRKDVALASGGYRKVFLDADDYDLWLRMSERSKLANLEKCVLRYRIHSNQVSIRNMRSQKMCALAARVAALQRRAGYPDPSSEIEEITPQFLSTFGVTEAEIQQGVLGGYQYWMDVLGPSDPEAALRVIKEFLASANFVGVDSNVRADALLRAAAILFKQKEPARAMAFAGRAVLLRPSAAINVIRHVCRVRIWHPLLNVTRPIRHTLGLRQMSAKATDREVNADNGYKEWADREFAAPSPHFVKHKVLLRNGLRDATWVETGTFMGDTTSVLSRVAKMVYSIEPEPTLFSEAERRFTNERNVKMIMGLSEDVFPRLLPTISGDICFWLDGHYSAGITFKGPQDTPIMDELSAIGENIAQMSKVVVMVDDIRCFDPKNPEFSAYPAVDVLIDWARKHNLNWHIEHDIFIAKNH